MTENYDDMWIQAPSKRKSKSATKKLPKALALPEWMNAMEPMEMVPNAPCMIILAGMPGSGKSTFSTKLEELSRGHYVRVNQDDLGSRSACLTAATQAMQIHKSVIIDRCNGSKKQRIEFCEAAKKHGYKVYCIVFNINREVCLARCQARTGHPTLPPSQAAKVIGYFRKDWEDPSLREGFASLQVVGNDSDLRNVLEGYASGILPAPNV